MARFEVEIRELKQNPSEVIKRAQTGATFSVLRNGKQTNVVIRTEEPAKQRWVSADQIREALQDLEADDTGWLEELKLERGHEQDPITNSSRISSR